ncbi:MAG: hypothetical protein ACXW2T_10530 [Allosphingosinicella sp.]
MSVSILLAILIAATASSRVERTFPSLQPQAWSLFGPVKIVASQRITTLPFERDRL